MQVAAPEERESLAPEQAKKRDELQLRTKELAGKRDDYISDHIEAEGGAEDSLDHKLFRILSRQAEAKGMTYEAPAIALPVSCAPVFPY